VSSGQPEELNLTPYLDVLMNLIVFVLVSGAGLVTWGALPATAPAMGCADCGLPKVLPRLHLERERISLSVHGEEASAVTFDELGARLSSVQGRALVLDAARHVTLEQVVSAMDAARKAHFDEVTLAD
jgi:biopolymer transport protein ExbD